MDIKKILTIIGLVVFLIGMTILVYIFFFKPAAPTVPQAEVNATATPGGLPQVGNAGPQATTSQAAGRLEGIIRNTAGANFTPSEVADGGLTNVSQVTENNVFAPTLNSSGRVVYFDQNTNYFYQQTPSGPQKLTDQAFYGATGVTWSPNGQKAVISYPDSTKVIYDFQTKKQVSVPKEFSEIQFAQDNEHLAAKQVTADPNKNWLVVFSADGSQMRGVERLGDNADHVNISWSPNNQVVGFSQESRGAAGSEVFPLGQNQENFASFVAPGLGFKSLWSPSTADNTFLFSSSKAEDGYRPRLYLGRGASDNPGNSQVDLGLQTTIDKCAFNSAGTAAYCAVPESLPQGSGPFPSLASGIQNDFYKIDLTTGQTKLVGLPLMTIEGTPQAADVGQVMVGPNDNILYFTDATSGRVYQMRLR